MRRYHDLVDAEEAAHGFDAPLVRRIEADQHQRHHDGCKDLPAVGVERQREQGGEHANGAGDPGPMVFQPPRGLASGIGKPDQGRREYRQERPIPPAPVRQPFVATRRPAQRRQRQQDRVFGDPREHIRRDQACEQPAHHAAERQRHIEAGEIFRGRPRARQLAMTGHRDDEETELMSAECQQQILFAADRKQYDDAGDRQRLGQQYPFMRQQWPRLEHQHPGQQIKRQRQHPQ